jgi:eukaryotic-like serine/threonine-protein kinase
MTQPEKIGKYEIQGILGKGGMGVVYKGYDRAIARSVAIKAITKASLAPDELKHVVERFRHEAQAVGRLVHPRIVQIYDYGEDDEIAYIVMELVNGKTLAEHIEQENGYEPREVGDIIRELLDGVGHAHVQGVVHRDIKPSNILINNDGHIKISDFGIARIESSDLTQVGDVLGTPHYMAPEQFLGTQTDALADLFSVGVIAYEMLTGKKPFNGNSATIMQQVLNEQPTNPSKLNPRLSPEIDSMVQKALAKKREDRYRNAAEFARALRDALDATPATGAAPPVVADGAALLGAARLLSGGISGQPLQAPQVIDEMLLAFGADSAVSLDTGIKKAWVLLVDDEERILTALKSLFRSRYHVFVTTDGNKALNFIRKYHVHLIVSDQRMPAMAGVELLRQAREISPRSVRILLTGYSDLSAIIGSINDGEVYRFINKPWNNNELQTIVAEGVTIALELADTKAPKIELPEKMDAGVLVIDSDEEIFRVVRELIAGLCPVVYAADLDSALAVMQRQEIAVVMTDVESARGQLTTMLKILKQENPQTLTIVVTTASDSELAIELINQAQIFRFLNKPVNVRTLKGHLHAALQRYLTFKRAPALVDAYRVQPSEQVRSSSVGQRILDSIKSLRGRWLGKNS